MNQSKKSNVIFLTVVVLLAFSVPIACCLCCGKKRCFFVERVTDRRVALPPMAYRLDDIEVESLLKHDNNGS